MDGEAACVADIGHMIEQLKGVDELAASLAPAHELEPDKAAIATRQILVGSLSLRPRLNRRVDDLRDGWATRSPTVVEPAILAIWLGRPTAAGRPALANPAEPRPIRDTRNVLVVGGRLRAEPTLADRNKTLVPSMMEPCERPIMFDLTQTAELDNRHGDVGDLAWVAFLEDVRRRLAKEPPAAAVARAVAAVTRPKGEQGDVPSLAEDDGLADGMVEESIFATDLRFAQV